MIYFRSLKYRKAPPAIANSARTGNGYMKLKAQRANTAMCRVEGAVMPRAMALRSAMVSGSTGVSSPEKQQKFAYGGCGKARV
jgi:hypothetical protein